MNNIAWNAQFGFQSLTNEVRWWPQQKARRAAIIGKIIMAAYVALLINSEVSAQTRHTTTYGAFGRLYSALQYSGVTYSFFLLEKFAFQEGVISGFKGRIRVDIHAIGIARRLEVLYFKAECTGAQENSAGLGVRYARDENALAWTSAQSVRIDPNLGNPPSGQVEPYSLWRAVCVNVFKTDVQLSIADKRKDSQIALANAPAPGPSRWYQNGSILYLVADGPTRRLYYEFPANELAAAGVKKGALFFTGRKDGNRYIGDAFSFVAKCKPHSFVVTGDISEDEKQVTLRGKRPSLNAACKIASYSDEPLVLTFIPGEGQ